jgi:hypothetical protein
MENKWVPINEAMDKENILYAYIETLHWIKIMDYIYIYLREYIQK